MKTIFDKKTRDGLIERIDTLNEKSNPQWGKMNIYQMLKHCTLCEEMYLGKTKYKRAFIGYLFGKIGLRNLLKDETPLKRNAPTSSAFKISEINGNVPSEKQKWLSLMQEYENFSNHDFVHWFFGKMSAEQVGYLVYKHTDHHLRQFNA
jgi:hypothetical protein